MVWYLSSQCQTNALSCILAQHDHMEVWMFASSLANKSSWKELACSKKHLKSRHFLALPVMKTSIDRQPWLRHRWDMLMPWFCFHWVCSSALAYHRICVCIESLCVNCHNMCFCLLKPHQAPLFEQSSGDNAGCLFWQKSHHAFMPISFGLSSSPACHHKLERK